jgi:hypothetical protein
MTELTLKQRKPERMKTKTASKSPKRSTVKSSKPREVFSVRFSEHELASLRKAAASNGASLAGWVRQTAVAAIDHSQPYIYILGSQSDASARAQVFSEDDRENVWMTS